MSGHDGHDTTDPSAGSSTDHGSMITMYFHFGTSATILFDFWKTSDIGSLLGSVVLIFFMAVAYEALKFYRDYLHRNHLKAISYNTITVPLENGSNVTEVRTGNVIRVHMFSTIHIVQTLLHMIQFVMSYFLMLIFMTYNVWLCTAVALGAGAGYFVFGWQRAIVVDFTEHCH